jgi:hypothetical protein
MDDVASCANPSGFLDVVGRDPENGTTIYGFGGDDALFGSLAAVSLSGRFGHADNIKQGSGHQASDLGLPPVLPAEPQFTTEYRGQEDA